MEIKATFRIKKVTPGAVQYTEASRTVDGQAIPGNACGALYVRKDAMEVGGIDPDNPPQEIEAIITVVAG